MKSIHRSRKTLFNYFEHQTIERKAMAANVKTCGMVTDSKKVSQIFAADSPKQGIFLAWTTFIEHKGWTVI